MAGLMADARPTKTFFLDMFTRDIPLDACVLDLIDNSIDALIRSERMDVSENLLLSALAPKAPMKPKRWVKVRWSDQEFSIQDNCGGIPFDLAQNEVFRFGHVEHERKNRLGIYGVGLKRAVFKIGNTFKIHSTTRTDGFVVSLDDVEKWASEDKWELPMVKGQAAVSPVRAGTIIMISTLHPEVMTRLKEPRFEEDLLRRVGETYALFLDRIAIEINGQRVKPEVVPIAESGVIKTGRERFKESSAGGTVSVTLVAGVTSKEYSKSELSGWYVLCNGRTVVRADRTELTGWGAEKSPSFHDKFRGFVGYAYFFADNPLVLPWTTTKHGLNRESRVYLRARSRMQSLARPITDVLSRMYGGDAAESLATREVLGQVRPVDLARIVQRKKDSPFAVAKKVMVQSQTVRVQYDARLLDIDRVRKQLGKKSMSARQVGEYTFNHYLRTECGK